MRSRWQDYGVGGGGGGVSEWERGGGGRGWMRLVLQAVWDRML